MSWDGMECKVLEALRKIESALDDAKFNIELTDELPEYLFETKMCLGIIQHEATVAREIISKYESLLH